MFVRSSLGKIDSALVNCDLGFLLEEDKEENWKNVVIVSVTKIHKSKQD